MKLDYDLIRGILLYIENVADESTTIHIDFICEQFKEIESPKVRYHVKYLRDANFIEHQRDVHIIDITPSGRDYLNSVRDNSVWEETKKKFQPLGTVTLSVVSEIAKSLILNRLGL